MIDEDVLSRGDGGDNCEKDHCEKGDCKRQRSDGDDSRGGG